MGLSFRTLLRPRFGLRLLLGLVAVLSVVLGVKVKEVRQQRRLMERIASLGGTSRTDRISLRTGFRNAVSPAWLRQLVGEEYFENIIHIDLNDTQANDDDLQVISRCHELTFLMLKGTAVTDLGTPNLRGLKNLRSLILSDTKITDAAIEDVAQVPLLGTLRISETAVTDGGVAKLRAHKQLNELFLGNTKVTGKSLAHAATCPRLRLVWLEQANVDPNDILPLANCPGFEILALIECGITDDHLAGINRLGKVGLFFDDNPISDAGLQTLSRMSNVEAIYVAGSKVTDASLDGLKDLPNLIGIGLGRTAVTDAGTAKLANCSLLFRIGLEGTEITDTGLVPLARLKGLAALNLNDTPISDASVATIARLRALQQLSIQRTRISSQGVAQIRSALPQCTINPE